MVTFISPCGDLVLILYMIDAQKCWQKFNCDYLDFRKIKVMFSSANF